MMGQAENEHHTSIACSHNNGHSYLKAPIMPTRIGQKEQYCLGTNFLFCKFKIKKNESDRSGRPRTTGLH